MLLFVCVLFMSGRRDFPAMFAWAWVAGALIVMVRSFFTMKKEFSFVFDRAVKAKGKKRMFWYILFSQSTATLIRFRLNVSVFLMGIFLSYADIALYNVAFRIDMTAGVLLEGFNSIFPAVAGNLYEQDKIGEIRVLHKKTAVILGGISVGIFSYF